MRWLSCWKFVERFKFVMQFVILGLVFFCCHCKCLRESFYFLRLPLEGMKRKIIRNLRMLESQGVVTIKNDYQDIINAIAKVIYLNVFGWTFSPHFVAFVIRIVTQRSVALRLKWRLRGGAYITKLFIIFNLTFVAVVTLVLVMLIPFCGYTDIYMRCSSWIFLYVSSFSLTYRIWSFCRTSETREGTVKDGDKKRKNWGRLWKACRISRSSMKNKSTTTINISECV